MKFIKTIIATACLLFGSTVSANQNCNDYVVQYAGSFSEKNVTSICKTDSGNIIYNNVELTKQTNKLYTSIEVSPTQELVATLHRVDSLQEWVLNVSANDGEGNSVFYVGFIKAPEQL